MWADQMVASLDDSLVYNWAMQSVEMMAGMSVAAMALSKVGMKAVWLVVLLAALMADLLERMLDDL